ncbi:MAG: leucine-rich repeat domain-containing protein [Acidobacteria bacterium]|nr:leucine-rich repeat domain-containing protein [Acidobacteriota bacterium]
MTLTMPAYEQYVHRFWRKIRLTTLLVLLACGCLAQGANAEPPVAKHQERLAAIRDHIRSKGLSFQVGENPALDYSLDERCGFVPEMIPESVKMLQMPLSPDKADLPARFDWRDFGAVTPARDQLGCGSSWAFATLAVLESQVAIHEGILVDLSEQQLVSCDYYNHGCLGGFWGFHYLQEQGAWPEDCFPYEASSDIPCAASCPELYLVESYAMLSWPMGRPDIPPPDELKRTIMEYGPLLTSVHVSDSFVAYMGGVYDDHQEHELCGTNHTVALVGWDDTLGDGGCWIIKNSWGPDWGEDGFMTIEYGCNLIGIGSCCVTGISKITPDTIPATERQALESLYLSTSGAEWRDNDRWLEAPGTECRWYGVECDFDGQHVIGLNLNDNRLQGAIPAEIVQLDHLTSLDLGGSSYGTDFPLNNMDRIAGLPELHTLILNYRHLSSFPAWIAGIANLRSLDLSNNGDLAGDLPVAAGQLSQLQRLDLSWTGLGPGFPGGLLQLTGLTELDLSHTALQGPIPPEIGDLSNLRRLALEECGLSGPLPEEFYSLTRLEDVNLRSNELSGPIAPETGDLAGLRRLDISANSLIGPLPPAIGRLRALESLNLANNQLSGDLPEEIAQMSRLETLDLSFNQFDGELPSSLSRLSHLRMLWLSDNELSGDIPVSLANLGRLENFGLCYYDLGHPSGRLVGIKFKNNNMYTSDPVFSRFLRKKGERDIPIMDTGKNVYCLAHLAENEFWETRVHLVNAGEEDHTLAFYAVDAEGDIAGVA